MSPRPRLVGLDLIRLASFLAIAFFHISLIHYYEHDVPLSDVSRLAAGIEVYARSLAFSGFTIIFMTCLLLAYSSDRLGPRMRLFAFLIFGWIIFCLFMGYSYSEFLVWDIYPLVMVGMLTATAAERLGDRALGSLAILGAVLLCIPFWEFAPIIDMDELWRHVLGFAACDSDISEWPILPWIGLVWTGYAAGVALRRGIAVNARQLYLTRGELITWVVLLLASVPQWGPFYNIQLGDRFSCEAYRMPPLVFWSHMAAPLFLIRASVDPRVNAWLSGRRWAQWVSRLAISRKFWAAYFLNFLIAHLLSWIANTFGITGSEHETSWIVFLAIIFMPLTEWSTRAVIWAMQRLRRT
jgi:hypothetical protein